MRQTAGGEPVIRRTARAIKGAQQFAVCGGVDDAHSCVADRVTMRSTDMSSDNEPAKAPATANEEHSSAMRSLASVMERLNRAIDHLDNAIESRLDHQAGIADTEAEVQRMGADRTRLAESLDKAEARAQRLETTNREVAGRLVNAMETIRSVLEGPAPKEG